MIVYEDESKYNLFYDKMKFLHNDNEKFMYIKNTKEWPIINISPGIYLPNKYPFYNLTQYVKKDVEIEVNKITGHNVSIDTTRKYFFSNRIRVENAIPYILDINQEDVRPIILHKIGEDYYIDDGKHRFYAYLLLNIKKVPAVIYEYNNYHEIVRESYIDYDKYNKLFIIYWKNIEPVKLNTTEYCWQETIYIITQLIEYEIKITDEAFEQYKKIINDNII